MVGSKVKAVWQWQRLGLSLARFAGNGGLRFMSNLFQVVAGIKQHPRTSIAAIGTILGALSALASAASGWHSVAEAIAGIVILINSLGLVAAADGSKVDAMIQAGDDQHATNEMRIRALEKQLVGK
jgi:sulfite exporter TauE/SafE